MRRSLAILLLALASLGLSGQERLVILVTPLRSALLGSEECRVATDAVIARLMESPRFSVVSEAGRELALAEMERSRSAAFAEAGALEAGRLVQADLVLSLGVGSLGEGRSWATVRVVEVATGKLHRAGSQEFAGLDRIAERLRDLAGRTLEIGGESAGLAAAEEYLLIPSSAQKVFQSLTLGGSWYAAELAAHRFSSLGFGIGSLSVFGRPLGFHLGASFVLPSTLEWNGSRQAWLSRLGFPWGVNLDLGASWLQAFSERFLAGLAAGLHMAEYQYYPPWELGSAPVQAEFGADPFWPLAWNLGPFLAASAYLRLSKDVYLVVGCSAARDLVEILAGYAPAEWKLAGGAWSVSPFIALAQGK